jgi:ATP-dependent Zn protease
MPAFVVFAALFGLVAMHVRAARWSVSGASIQHPGTPEERLQWLSAHESGHAVAARHCPLVGRILGVAIEPTTEDGALWRGKVTHDWSVGPRDRGRLWWDAVISLAGLAAETLCYGEVRTLLLRDVDDALRCVRALCAAGDCFATVGPRPMPLEVQCAPVERAMLSHAWSAAYDLVSQHADEHAALTRTLVSKRALSAIELSSLMTDHPRAVTDRPR